MENLTESSNIAELISVLINCWKSFNSNHQMAMDSSLLDEERNVAAELTEVNMKVRYYLINKIDEVMEVVLGQA